MGGRETMGELRKIDSAVKAIVTSGYDQDPVLKNFQIYGFQAALAKPFLINEIRAVLTQVLGKGNPKEP
jgi:CheY-like chemotaxis protein